MAGKFLAKKPRKNRRKTVLGILLLCFAVLTAFSAWKLLSAQEEYDAGTEVYAALTESAVQWQQPEKPREETREDAVFLPTRTEETQTPNEPQPEEPQADEPQPGETEPAEEQLPAVDFAMLAQINPQAVGWIWSADGISYPVVQGTDNEYYLNHLFDGTENRNGAIFVDYRNTPGFADRNTFIYGHNMLNGAMFASLANYGTPGYYEKYPRLLLVTPEQTCALEVFAGYVTPGDSDIYQLTFAHDEDFDAYLRKIRALSDFASEVAVTAQDSIVTLSTCTYDYEDARYVLHCKLTPIA